MIGRNRVQAKWADEILDECFDAIMRGLCTLTRQQKQDVRDIGPYAWQKFARELTLDPDSVLARVAQMAGAIPDQVSALRDREQEKGLSHPVVGRLVEEIVLRARRCARVLEGALRNRKVPE